MYQVQEWLYTDGEDANGKEFEEHLDMLKAIGDPIFFRLKELKERPTAVELANKYLTEIQQIVQRWKTNKAWIPQERINEVLDAAEKLKSWLDEKNNEQKRSSGFSKAVFTSDEVYTMVFSLQEKVTEVDKIPKPKPPQAPKKNETDGSAEKENDSKIKSDSTDGTESKMPDPGSSSPSEEPANTVDSKEEEKPEPESKVHDEL